MSVREGFDDTHIIRSEQDMVLISASSSAMNKKRWSGTLVCEVRLAYTVSVTRSGGTM